MRQHIEMAALIDPRTATPPVLKRPAERGDTKIGCLIWILITIAIVMIGAKAVPVRMKASTLTDYMNEQAKFAKESSPRSLTARILRKARELELPVTQKQIQVRKTSSRVRMRCEFTVPLDFPFYTYHWDFDIEVDRAIFYF